MASSTKAAQPKVFRVHRYGAALLGVGLVVFAVLTFSSTVPWVSTSGAMVLGLSANGALALLSVLVGAVLIFSAWWGDPFASTVTITTGGLFLLSGLVHLGLIHTSWNILAFRLSNVFFSLIVGLLLLFLGFYGRVSGGLPPDNPYRRARPVRRDRPSPYEQESNVPDQRQREMLEAELAVSEGNPTGRQRALVEQEWEEQRQREYRRAWGRKDPN